MAKMVRRSQPGGGDCFPWVSYEKRGLYRRRIHLIFLLFTLAQRATAQQLEPRAYAALPKNLNTVVIAYGISRGNVLADPSLPITNFEITTNTISAHYLHTFEVGGKLARIQVSLPYVDLAGKLQIDGHDTSGARSGLA